MEERISVLFSSWQVFDASAGGGGGAAEEALDSVVLPLACEQLID